MNIDELNVIKDDKPKRKSIPYKQFFGEMDIPEYSKKKRIRLAKKIEDAVDQAFTAIAIMSSVGFVSEEYYARLMAGRYQEAIADDVVMDDYVRDHIQFMANNFAATTIRHEDDEYYTSEDRAMVIAENEANILENYAELQAAKDKGFTSKIWKTMKDRKVRHTHVEVDGEEIAIDLPFQVGQYEMMMPLDESLGAGGEEIVNCRCVLKFGRKYPKIVVDSSQLNEQIESDIIQEKFRKQSFDDLDNHYISDERYESLIVEAKKNGAVVLRGTEEVEEHLNSSGASAAIIGDVILFRENVTVSDVLEETYHYMQNVRGLNNHIDDALMKHLLNEIDAQKHLISIASQYRIPRKETEQTIRALAKYEQRLIEHCRKLGVDVPNY